jgi:tripartite-type tricarboxylate transporter receptor subunit TctC
MTCSQQHRPRTKGNAHESDRRDLLQTEIARIIHLPDVKDKLLAIGLEPDGMSPATFAAYIKADVAKWKKVIADAKIPQIGG